MCKHVSHIIKPFSPYTHIHIYVNYTPIYKWKNSKLAGTLLNTLH